MLNFRSLRHLIGVGLGLLLMAGAGSSLRAGGSGLNVAVVVNQNSTNSLALGNYFCEQRQVPPDNVLRISWAGGSVAWTRAQFQTNLLSPLLAMLASRELTNQIDHVVLSMDIPYRVTDSNGVSSTTSSLFYGFKSGSGADVRASTNSYAGSEAIFSQARPASAPGYSFLATMITASSLTQAKRIVDQGVASDGAFPTQTVMLAKSSDPLRNGRYRAFDNALFNTRLCSGYSVVRTNSDSPWGHTNMLGYQTGLANFSILPNTFVPGAMADSMTSFGGMIFESTGQTTLLAFLNAGAAGSYGTVTEPSPSPDRFPDPQNHFYQSRGFSLAECYYQSLTNPALGLVVGEPLAAPFRRVAVGSWSGVVSNSVLSGVTNLSLQFAAAGPQHPLQQIDLFVNGRFYRTLTNLTPLPGNALSVTVNGHSMNYLVPTNATLKTLADGLGAVLNDPANTNLTKVRASVHGDRLQLHALATNAPAGLVTYVDYVDEAATNFAYRFYRVVRLPRVSTATLAARGFDRASGGFQIRIEAEPGLPYTLQASTDLIHWVPIFTNQLGGPLDFIDPQAAGQPTRFYRIAPTTSPAPPKLTPLGRSGGGGFRLHIDSPPPVPYVIHASTNLFTWSPIFTNWFGGPMEFIDPESPLYAQRFYRVETVNATDQPRLRPLGRAPGGGFRLLVTSPPDTPCYIEASEDLLNWSAIFTNQPGGLLDFVDWAATNHARRFYRARIVRTIDTLSVAFIGHTDSGGNVLRVQDESGQGFVLMASTDLTRWVALFTNTVVAKRQVAASSAPGSGGALTTFLQANRDEFLDSPAYGMRACSVNGTLQVGTYLRLSVTKTNGSQVSVGVTNQTPGTTISQLTQQLFALVNSTVGLQGEDGLVAEDFTAGFLGAALFNLRARSTGLAAAQLQVSLTGSSSLVINPGIEIKLDENLADLLPRHHLYVTAGATNLSLNFPLDTAALPDGSHELTAVAYEGTHVRTQTRCTLAVRIQNTSLSASVSVLGAGPTAPVQSTFHIEIAANDPAVSRISLFSTGGLLSAVTNQPSATFPVNGQALGLGLHPFYAIVTTTNGLSCRTEKVNVRLVAP